MNSARVVLGALNLDFPKQNRAFGRGSALVFSDVLLILGVGVALLVVLAGAIYLWSKLGRKPRRHISNGEKVYRGSKRHPDDPEGGDADAIDASEAPDEHEHEHDDDAQSDHSRRRYKYRVRRRTHRSRNPTLSETGGLPPVKAQEPSKPA